MSSMDPELGPVHMYIDLDNIGTATATALSFPSFPLFFVLSSLYFSAVPFLLNSSGIVFGSHTDWYDF
jgi:hypothetical protein